MVFYDSIWQDRTDTGRSTVSYIVFYQVEPIDHCTHFSGPVAQSSDGSGYITACTARMDLDHFNKILTPCTDYLPETP